MFDFVDRVMRKVYILNGQPSYTPNLAIENSFTGCHGNHAFSHSSNRFFMGFFSHSGGPRDQFGTNSKFPWGAR